MAATASETIRFVSDGVTLNAFLAFPTPPAAGRLPAVLVLQEWWGLNDHIKEIARRFAGAGYVSCAPDLYARLGSTGTTDPKEAAQLMSRLSSQTVLRDLNAAIQSLKQRPLVDPLRIGMVGFCMGGTFALMMASHNSDLKAVVPFYGKVPPVETLRYLVCPVLYHYGAKDGWVTSQEVDRLRQGLAAYGKAGVVHVYPEANHAFFNDTRPDVYRAEEAALAWERTLQFLGQRLRP